MKECIKYELSRLNNSFSKNMLTLKLTIIDYENEKHTNTTFVLVLKEILNPLIKVH